MTPPVSVRSVATLPDPTRRALVSLAEAAAAAGLPHPSDQAMLDLQLPPDGHATVALAGDPVQGFALLTRHGASWVVETALRPGVEPEPTRTALLTAVLGALAAEGGGQVRLWRHGGGPAPDDSPPADFTLERELLQLRVPLPLAQPAPAVSTRPFRVGEDEAAWVAVNNRAFAAHPEQSGWTVADVRQREAEPWFDPAGFLLHEATGRLAAFCWTKEHRATALGEIYVIAADPTFQGRGLGKAMTMAGLAHLASRGIATGMLYVDADNQAAVHLYRSLGFELHHTDRAYLADVPAAATAAVPAAVPAAGDQEPRATPTARPIP